MKLRKTSITIGLVGVCILLMPSAKASERISLDQLLATPDPVKQLNDLKVKNPDNFKHLCDEIRQQQFYLKAKQANIGTIKQTQIINACESRPIQQEEYKGQKPVQGKEKKLLTPEEMAHKMWLLKQAMPDQAKDVIKSQIGPTLHAVNTKTFTCPTADELQRSIKQPDVASTGYEFEKNGIYFETGALGLPTADAKLDNVGVLVKYPENKISKIECTYRVNEKNPSYFPMFVNFSKSGLNQSLVTISQNDLSLGFKVQVEGGVNHIFGKNIEFIVQPLPKK